MLGGGTENTEPGTGPSKEAAARWPLSVVGSLVPHPQALLPVAFAARLAAHPVVREAVALLALVGVVLFSFRDAIIEGVIGFEKDTQVFYYPLHYWFTQEVQSGRFPLWNPYIFAGYPIFADGEIGAAYPVHLLLLRLLPVEQLFVWLRLSSVIFAALAMYALCRALGLGRLPCLLGGITFSLGSFFVAQQHHENVTRTAAWLPLVLACIEWSLHRAGWRRHLFLTLAAAALAMAAVGLHGQVLLMTLLTFSSFVVFRVLVGPVGARPTGAVAPIAEGAAARSWWRKLSGGSGRAVRRFALMCWVGVYVGGLGLGLGSVQLLPLAELGADTFRGTRPNYAFASSYALPVHNLVDLVLPYFFRSAESDYWSLWAKWETTVYVGIVALILGLVGLVIARRREVWYFGGMAMVSLWLAFASYAPFDLYRILWSVPGFSSFRVPGRYTFLFVVAWSVLAAFGLQAAFQAAQGPGIRRRRIGLALLCVLAAGTVAGLAYMGQMRGSLVADQGSAEAMLNASYLALPHHPEGLEASDVYRGLVFSLDLGNSRTRLSVLLIGLGLALTAGALVSRRTARWWQLGLVALAAVDLYGFGMNYHQKLPVGQIIQSTAATEFLADQLPSSVPGGRGVPGDYWRVFTPGTIYSLEFNRLLPFRIEDIGGYSSAESRGSYSYWTTIANSQNQLLDVGNVRYLVYSAFDPSYPSYHHVPFDPDRPLVIGGKDSIGASDAYDFGGITAHRIQIISGLTRAADIPQGTTVAEVTVYPRWSAPFVLPIRAGIESAEWAYDRSDVRAVAKHERPDDIAFRRPDVSLLDGARYDRYFFYAERDLPGPMQIDRVELRYVYERGGMELYGLGFFNFDTGATVGATPQMRAKLRLVHQDREVRLYENRDAFPRAYVVPTARVAPEGTTGLSAMQDTPFDPARQVMLEWDEELARKAASATTASGPRGAPAAADIVDLTPDRVVFRALAPEGGYLVHVANYFPGWRAKVDGREAPILRANSLFRAIPLDPGEHVVELRYQPLSVALGSQLTILAACMGAAALLGTLLAHRWSRVRAAAKTQQERG